MAYGDDGLDRSMQQADHDRLVRGGQLLPTEQLVIVTKVRYGYVDNVKGAMLSLTVTGLDCDTTLGLYQHQVDALLEGDYIEDVFSLKNKPVVVRYDNGLFRFVRLFKT